MTPAPHMYLSIAPGEKATTCKGCGITIYFAKNAKDRRIPVDPAYDENCSEPTATEPGQGLNHFQNCPMASNFSRQSKKKGERTA